MRYIKELDALRGLAILSVITHHWFPKGSIGHHVSNVIDAPNIFFTVSGFLITKILLTDRLRAEAEGTAKHVAIWRFLVKRAIRILPAYYLTILLTYLLKNHALTWLGYLSHATFTGNFYIHHKKNWGELAHLWSMGVEQQFYVLWPLVIFFVPRRHLLSAILGSILIGLVSQFLLPVDGFSHVLSHTVLDALGLGALLAWVMTFRPGIRERVYQILSPVAAVSLLLILVQSFWGNLIYLHNRTLMALVVCWLILHLVVRQDALAPPIRLVFRHPALLFLGKISYGLYLYHITLNFHAYKWFAPLNERLPMALQQEKYWYIFQNFVLLVGLAWLSWKFLEMPLLQASKRLLPEKKQPIRVPAPAVPMPIAA